LAFLDRASPHEDAHADSDGPEVRPVRVRDLLPGETARLAPEDRKHTSLLASIEEPLPPILVHRATMRIIDGHHRVQAARLCGWLTIPVRFFDGTLADAFLEGVRANVSHGKPLTLAERESAARHLLTTHKHQSDRSLATACGLSPQTIASLRRDKGDTALVSVRIGLDGRRRPTDPASGRERAAQLIRSDPSASLRTVAREAGISPGTVRDVRIRLDRGEPPVPSRTQPSGDEPSERSDRGALAPIDHQLPAELSLEDRPCWALEQDSSFVDTPPGARLVAWLHERRVSRKDWIWIVQAVPVSRVYAVADVVRQYAAAWTHIADELERGARRGR
jgi:ParB-like chromosome segregation protein Spo0J